MKSKLALAVSVFLYGCGTTTMPVQMTGVEGEYVVSSTNQESVFSSLEKAQKASEKTAIETCNKKGLTYKKKYTIDRPLKIGQVPESVLYFTCVAQT